VAETDDTRVSPGVEPGSVLAGKFRVERVLNAGGMGVILVAYHIQLDQRVAIKVLRTHILDEPEVVARFAREARIAAKIRSEHVVRVLDVGSLPNGSPYMVMEYLQGSDLSALVKARGPLAVEEAVEYVLQACEALAEAHLAGVVHRDLKPANLFLTRRADGTSLLKVLDFGISKVIAPLDEDSAMTKTAVMMGSPHYMSPEQLKSARSVDARADIWALGVVLYKLVTGVNPFNAETTPELCVEILHGKPTALAKVAPAAPAGLGEVIERCLKKKPADRFRNVAELAHALAPFASTSAKASVDRIEGVYRAAPPPPSHSSDDIDTHREGNAQEPSVAVDTDAGGRTITTSVSKPRAQRSRRLTPWIAAGALVAGIGGTLAITQRGHTGSTAAPIAPSSVVVTASPTETQTIAPTATTSAAPIVSAQVTTATASTHRIATTRSVAATSAPPPASTTAPATSSSSRRSDFGGPF
jgi:serine/threonine-protein kinase